LGRIKLNFYENIDNLYEEILSSKDSICKKNIIKRCKFFLAMKEEDSFGDYYAEKIADGKKGVVYTPKEIVIYMINNTIKDDVVKNPFIKILDPSCGCGNILLLLFDKLREIYTKNLEEINKRHNLNLNLNNLNKHILDYNLYGIDIDATALKILAIELYERAEYLNAKNLINKDFLTDEIRDKFHIIIGNPPYVGTKFLDKEYGIKIRELYKDILNDKGDLSYCFFKKSFQTVYDNYKITLISSRYFMEALSGSKLRAYLLSESNIHKITDFYGIRPFKNTGIDPAIIFLGSDLSKDIIVSKPNKVTKGNYSFHESNFNTFIVAAKSLNTSPWKLQNQMTLAIIKKIEKKCKKTLGEICNSYQGIITGCDKAFIVTEALAVEHKIERDLLRPWIKSSSIYIDKEIKADKYIIYSNFIENEESHPHALRFIANYKDRLMNRRECRQGRRKWYELQWGRDRDIFEREKIIFPYKSADSRFVLDKGNYFSADVYSLVLKENEVISYEFLKTLLNSKIYEFYFKTFAKKLGGKLYEYYPNNLNRLYIPIEDITIDMNLFDYFQFSKKEISYIENYF
jgi:adenine-specific DNA-methyltransferase